MITDDELRALIALGDKATARPWQSFGTLVYSRNAVGMVCEMSYPYAELIEHRKLEHGDGKDAWDKSHDTREYLTAAANLAPAIARELIEAREALDTIDTLFEELAGLAHKMEIDIMQSNIIAPRSADNYNDWKGENWEKLEEISARINGGKRR